MPMWPDIINGTLELAGASFVCLNIDRILKDETVAGVHWASCVFFTTWGLWNLFYYPSLDQWFSFGGGVVLVIVNVVWLTLVYRYWPRETNNG